MEPCSDRKDGGGGGGGVYSFSCFIAVNTVVPEHELSPLLYPTPLSSPTHTHTHTLLTQHTVLLDEIRSSGLTLRRAPVNIPVLPGLGLHSARPGIDLDSIEQRCTTVLATEIRPPERCAHIAKNLNPPLRGSDFRCQHCSNMQCTYTLPETDHIGLPGIGNR